jgi:hypothetical protein
VKNYPQLDCVELERYIFPVLHVTLGLANRLLKHTIDYANLVVERTPILQVEAANKYATIKQEIADWGIHDTPHLRICILHREILMNKLKLKGNSLRQKDKRQFWMPLP